MSKPFQFSDSHLKQEIKIIAPALGITNVESFIQKHDSIEIAHSIIEQAFDNKSGI